MPSLLSSGARAQSGYSVVNYFGGTIRRGLRFTAADELRTQVAGLHAGHFNQRFIVTSDTEPDHASVSI